MKPIQTLTDGILVRVGTFLSAAFLGYGIEEHHVNLLVPAILVIAGIGIDLATGHVIKRLGR